MIHDTSNDKNPMSIHFELRQVQIAHFQEGASPRLEMRPDAKVSYLPHPSSLHTLSILIKLTHPITTRFTVGFPVTFARGGDSTLTRSAALGVTACCSHAHHRLMLALTKGCCSLKRALGDTVTESQGHNVTQSQSRLKVHLCALHRCK